MYQLTRRLIASMNTVHRPMRLRRLAATSAFALVSLITYQPAPAEAQAQDQICYAIADNSLAGGGGGNRVPDTLITVDLDTGELGIVNETNFGRENIRRPDGTTRILNIEALTSRPDFGTLIAANGNELGSINPVTGEFLSLGIIEGYVDFDAIVIDRSGSQNRLLAVSRDNEGTTGNQLVEVILELDDNGAAIGIAAQSAGIALSGFPPRTNSIDGIAISPAGVLAVANGGPSITQRLVGLNTSNGQLDDRGQFVDSSGTAIRDVEDLSFDLRGRLFATTGSSRNPTAETGYIYSDPGTGSLSNALFEIDLSPSGGTDFEASACLRPAPVVVGELLLVKRITAITRVGQETQRFDDFVSQENTPFDTQMRDATGGAFPRGIVEAPTTLQPGDEVEYTLYLFNPTETTFENVVLCDPIRRPSVLQRDNIQFSQPADATNTPPLDFENANNFDRAPLAPADDACAAALDGGDTFLAGPPGPTGPNGTGGGVVTDSFDIAPSEISATRFTVQVGAL